MILVIGGGKRIGKALVDSYAKKNIVLFTYHSSIPSKKLSPKVKGVPLNLHKISEIRRFAGSLRDRSVSTVLFVASTFYGVPFGRTSEKEWDDLADVNLKSAYFLCEAIRPKLKKGANVQFFNDALVDHYPPALLPYAAAKAGLSVLMKTLARAWAPDIRVNEIGIGYAVPPDGTKASDLKRYLKEIPLKKFSGVEPVISTSHFLSEQTYITGSRINVDGGLSVA